MNLKVIFLAVSLITAPAVLAQDAGVNKPQTPTKANARPETGPEPKPEPFDDVPADGLAKCVSLETAKGTITLEMFPDTAPGTVRNFLNLVAIGALKNTTFSRVVPEFVIQGGNLYSNPDITHEMSVRAHKKLADEPNLVRHERGIVSMARTDEPDSATTDFFILVRSAPGLDNKFAAFGRVIKGMDVVDEINGMPVDDEKPKNPVLLTSTEIVECTFQPSPAPKENELTRFGLRGKVRNVRLSASDSKRKTTVLASDGSFSKYFESELEFGEIGDLLETRFFDENGSLVRAETSTSTIMSPGKPPLKKELLKDASGLVLRETHFISEPSGIVAFRAFDEKKNVVGAGEIRSDASGRVVSVTWERLGKEGKSIGKLSEKFAYDAYGLEVTRILSDENAGETRYTRYEYTDFDDEGNWIERSVFDSEKTKDPVRFEKRVIKYFR